MVLSLAFFHLLNVNLNQEVLVFLVVLRGLLLLAKLLDAGVTRFDVKIRRGGLGLLLFELRAQLIELGLQIIDSSLLQSHVARRGIVPALRLTVQLISLVQLHQRLVRRTH